jgi:hypothetical protein
LADILVDGNGADGDVLLLRIRDVGERSSGDLVSGGCGSLEGEVKEEVSLTVLGSSESDIADVLVGAVSGSVGDVALDLEIEIGVPEFDNQFLAKWNGLGERNREGVLVSLISRHTTPLKTDSFESSCGSGGDCGGGCSGSCGVCLGVNNNSDRTNDGKNQQAKKSERSLDHFCFYFFLRREKGKGFF